MNRSHRRKRVTAGCLVAVMMMTAVPVGAATPTAGFSKVTADTLQVVTGHRESSKLAEAMAGISQSMAQYVSSAGAMAQAEVVAEAAQERSLYADIAIAQVDNFVNVRDAASEEGEVVGKLYNNSAAIVEATEGDWYKITSGNVTGYVKSEFVVCGDEELARSVSRRVATVHTETLFVRTEPTTDSDVLGSES